MMKVEIEKASNGIIKRIIDTNINGAGETFESVVVFDLDNDEYNKFQRTTDFIYELLEDISVTTGNTYAKSNLKLHTEWGIKYSPTLEEVKSRIEELQIEIKLLKELQKNLG